MERSPTELIRQVFHFHYKVPFIFWEPVEHGVNKGKNEKNGSETGIFGM